MLIMQYEMGGASAVLMTFDAPIGLSAQEVLNASLQQAAATMSIAMLSSGTATLGNLTGVSASLRVDAQGTSVLQDVIVAVSADIVYVVTLSAVEAMWDLFAEDFQEIKDSLMSWR
jgi:hypothetical protein